MLRKIIISTILLLAIVSIHAYPFRGTHYMATYSGCSSLEYNRFVLHALVSASGASGATIIQYSMHEFTPQGMTAVVLLGESHASIHTYPEMGSVFVDLFTCGDSCKWQPFEDMLVSYLEARTINRQIIKR